MPSNIDPSKPVDGAPAVKLDLRNNLQAAKNEIEALQLAQIPPGGASGQVLTKASASDFATVWQASAGGSGWPPTNVIRPEDFGASSAVTATNNAGAKANWDAFQAMFNAAPGRTIWLQPFATYYVQPATSMAANGSNFAPITIDNKDNFIVMGNGATLKHSNNVVLAQFVAMFIEIKNCDNFTFYDFNLDGNRQNISHPSNSEFGHGWLVRKCTNFRWFNCRTDHTRGDGWEVTSTFGGEETPANYCYYGLWHGCHANNNTRQGWSIEHLYHGKIIGCWATNTNGKSPQSGIDVEPFTSGSGTGHVIAVKDLLIMGCTIAGNAGGGYYQTIAGGVPGLNALRVGDCHLIGNHFDSNLAPSPIQILSGSCRFIGNTIRGHNTNSADPTEALIRFISSLDSTYECIFDSNRIEGNIGPPHAFWNHLDHTTGRIILSNNIINFPRGGGAEIINNQGPRLIVRNNHFVGSGSEVAIANSGANCAFLHNTYENIGTPLQNSGSSPRIDPTDGGWTL